LQDAAAAALDVGTATFEGAARGQRIADAAMVITKASAAQGGRGATDTAGFDVFAESYCHDVTSEMRQGKAQNVIWVTWKIVFPDAWIFVCNEIPGFFCKVSETKGLLRLWKIWKWLIRLELFGFA
jgi:hypothetical protein